ncbi:MULTISPECIES: acyl carrier protein [Micromonospora]|uniref:Acyl carrier protein n=2 Tax=Micromonospora TaxID=1873 RepID=A0A1C5HVZ0_9ACTN|nr:MULTISPECIES: acyl carrier protein [Micromonospora]SCF38347.1 acyl carrier protein [Micromonospora mirobrigensis]SCG49781.1 acyl carrier protein [Micromonospora siamensis]
MYEQLKDIVASKFQIDPGEIAPDSTLKGLELDSLDTVELSLVIEKELGAQVSDVELAEAQRLDEIVRLVESRTARI